MRAPRRGKPWRGVLVSAVSVGIRDAASWERVLGAIGSICDLGLPETIRSFWGGLFSSPHHLPKLRALPLAPFSKILGRPNRKLWFLLWQLWQVGIIPTLIAQPALREFCFRPEVLGPTARQPQRVPLGARDDCLGQRVLDCFLIS